MVLCTKNLQIILIKTGGSKDNFLLHQEGRIWGVLESKLM